MRMIQARIEMADWLAAKSDHNMLSRTIIDVDPITQRRFCTVYSDDGRGNGTVLFQFDMD